MSDSHSMLQPKSKMRTFLKFLMAFLVVLIVLAIAAHFVWKNSGSNQWELEHEIDGVKVYSLKAPGFTIKKYKVIGRFKAKLGPIMKVMRDPSACDDVGCYDSYIIEKKDYPQFVYYTFRYPTDFPFKPREYVVLSEFRQNPETKEIYVDYQAAVDKLPPSDCCVRVTHMHNIWKFIPLADGDVEVDFIMDHDPGGVIPYFLVNSMMSDSIHTNIPDLQAVLDKEKYRNATVDYVKEVNSNSATLSGSTSGSMEIDTSKTL